MPAPLRYIDPEVLSRLASLELVARTVVEGFLAGLHKSPYRGFSVDFMEYRSYSPGDDPLRIDWKLYARTDRYYVKEYEDETNAGFHLLVDVSPSMDYGSGALAKRDYAFFLASSLAYFADRQRDAIGLSLFDDDVRQRRPPLRQAGQLQALLRMLEAAPTGRPTALHKPLHTLADLEPRRGFVVLISDLLDDPEIIADGLKHFRFNGHEVLVFHVLDPQEVAFDFDDMVEFEDIETGDTLVVPADAAKTTYRTNLDAYLATLQRTCGLHNIDYTRLTTDQPLDEALFAYLAKRARAG